MKNAKKDTTSSGNVSKSEVPQVKSGSYFGKIRANPWIASTFVLGLVLVLVLIFATGSGGKVVSSDQAGEKVVSFLNSNPAIQGGVELVSATKEGQFYQVMLNYQGQQVPVYTTLDGAFLVGNPVALDGTDTTDTQTPTDTTVQADTTVPKSDKPNVELFVMSYCPYGTQIEKGILPVVQALGDKIDFEVKWVNYAMHGKPEVDENVRQYCIEEEQNDKYLDYLKCFLEDSTKSDACLTQTKVNKVKLAACVKKTDTQFDITKNFDDQASWLNGRYPKFMINDAENKQYGVQGSPTLVINGKQANSGRDPASLLATICNAFNEAPAECQTQLSSSSPSPGFGWTATAADSAALAQCG